jgi:hypothetical protein
MKELLIDRIFRILGVFNRVALRFKLAISRREAHRERKQLVRRTGRPVMTRKLKKQIKQYARKRFGSAAYWPHLAHFTEIRGEFIEGWIPEDYFRYILEPRLNPSNFSKLGYQKTFDYRRFGDFAIEPLFYFISGNFFDAKCRVFERNSVKTFFSEYHDTIVVKQAFGWGGKHVTIQHASAFRPEHLKKGHNYVIQPFIRQYKPLNDLYSDSVNTFRVTTFLKKNGTVEVLFVILRFGVDGIKVDNLSSGGQCIRFDLSGRPSPVAYDEYCVPVGERHKNTGFRFSELEIPMFPEIIDKCVTGHQRHPHVRLIGWDVCINQEGEPKLIEWNTFRPTFTLEDAMFGPFLTDDEELQ